MEVCAQWQIWMILFFLLKHKLKILHSVITSLNKFITRFQSCYSLSTVCHFVPLNMSYHTHTHTQGRVQLSHYPINKSQGTEPLIPRSSLLSIFVPKSEVSLTPITARCQADIGQSQPCRRSAGIMPRSSEECRSAGGMMQQNEKRLHCKKWAIRFTPTVKVNISHIFMFVMVSVHMSVDFMLLTG